MAVKRMRIKQLVSPGNYDTYYPETVDQQVLIGNGSETLATKAVEWDNPDATQVTFDDEYGFYDGGIMPLDDVLLILGMYMTQPFLKFHIGITPPIYTDSLWIDNSGGTFTMKKWVNSKWEQLAPSMKEFNDHSADYVRHLANGGTTTGNLNAYSCGTAPNPTTFTDKMGIVLTAHVDSGTSPTLKWGTLSAKSITNSDGSPATLKKDGIYTLRYNQLTGNFILQGEGGEAKINGEVITTAVLNSAVTKMDAVSCVADLDKRNKLTNPSTLPPSTGNGTGISADGNYFAVAHNSTPFVSIYKRNGDAFTKLANPSLLPPNTAYDVAFSPDGTHMVVGHGLSPYISIYKRDGDVFTKLSNPSVLPAGTMNGVAFSPDGNYMAVAHGGSPYVTVYKRDGDIFTKLLDPSTLPASTGNGVRFSSDGVYMLVVHNTTPFVTIYKRNGDVFTKLANPNVLPTGTANDVSISSDGVYMAVAHATSPFITTYRRDGDVFTKLPEPAWLPPSTAYSVAISSDGNYMAVGHALSPYIVLYRRDGDIFVKLPDPSVLPGGTPYGVKFSSDGVYLAVAHGSSPYITVYKSPTIVGKSANPLKFEKGAVWYGYAKEAGNNGQVVKIAKLWEA